MTSHVLVTGGASGLGLGCAKRFAELGARITLADINTETGEAAAQSLGGKARFEPLDLSNPGSIDDFANRLEQRGEPIDVLVNNAGIYPPSRRMSTVRGQELSFAIGHLGHYLLTAAVWPLLKAAPAARVISISSLVQRRARLHLDDIAFERRYSPIAAYAQTKLACLLFAIELQRRLERINSPIKSFGAHPGVCRTQLGSNRRVAPGDNILQRTATAMLGGMMQRFGLSPEEGAESIILAATTDRFPAGSFVGPTGLFDAYGPVDVVKLGKAAADPKLAATLWQRTEEITGVAWSPS